MTDDVLKQLGKNIHELREKKGITQQELAEQSNLSLPFISLIENSKRNVSLETLLKLLAALDVSLSEFFLPYSDGRIREENYLEEKQDIEFEQFLKLLQKSTDREKYIKLFKEILILSEK
ncbi:hypothetical protein BAU15_12290 [Enterococcus sp. JM4C]|uniref:helix-turn-helix domain-containing protein n=1 Tax=Candidatus Enterococcus huntleyi TaxID=1857217 RepID=UPI00137B1720|nr:helix-turn-helix transcriptional regulator [Enterococcus sp. JM4C]KAF1296054.1 hypothetical protein BAU15_12290 [Enterococcus sp. JM4C]